MRLKNGKNMRYDSSFWDERFNSQDYTYGKDPAPFFAEQLKKYPQGKILLPAEGEGRNAVYAATMGWEVVATDWSEVGQQKALALAKEKNVQINFQINNCTESEYPDGEFDAIGLFFFHLDAESREQFHAKMVRALKPGGVLIFEAFDRDQLGRSSGGPQNLDVLYSLQQITEDFIELDFAVLGKEKVQMDSGSGHVGEAVVIRFVGIKSVE